MYCSCGDMCLIRRCRFCQYDIRESESFYFGHHQTVLYAFFAMSCVEIFAVMAACMYKQCNTTFELADDTIELVLRSLTRTVSLGWCL